MSTINIGDHTYYIFDEKVTWEQARINCESLGGYLATFASEEEWKPMQLLLQSNQLHCWFGGYGNGSIETWKWITGEKWTYSDWCRGEPNNDFNGSENYLGTWTSTYQWNDYRPDTLLGFICEIGEVEELPILYNSGWAIANTATSFGYDSEYSINKSVYNDVLNPVGALLASINNKWNGNCFGMSVLSAMVDNDQIDLTKYFSVKDNGNAFSDFSYDDIHEGSVFSVNNNELISLIERCQVSQHSWAFIDSEIEKSDLLEFFKQNNKSLVFTSKNMGHAIVLNGKVEPVYLSENWYEFEVYDPNFPITNISNQLQSRAWFYNQNIGRNRRMQFNVSTGEWRYETYVSKEKYGYYSDTLFDDAKFYDTTRLPMNFLTSKLDLTQELKQKVYIYKDSMSLKITDKGYPKKSILEINNDEIKTYDGIKFYPIGGDNTNSDNPIGYVVIDSQNLMVESNDAKYAIFDNDNMTYIESIGECTVETKVSEGRTNILVEEETEIKVKIGGSTDAEYSILEISGVMEANEKIEMTLLKNSDLTISGKLDNQFQLTTDYTGLKNPITKKVNSDELTKIKNVKDIKPNVEETTFGSVTSSWAVDEVEEAFKEGLIPKSLIGVDLTKKINRSEFAAVAVALYENLTASDVSNFTSPFIDISLNKNRNAIQQAYGLGITSGTSYNMFSPNELITREQLATMLTRAVKKYKFPEWTLATDTKYFLMGISSEKFEDDGDISDYARSSVYFMVSANVIGGVGGNKFAPRSTATYSDILNYGMATIEQAIIMANRVRNARDYIDSL